MPIADRHRLGRPDRLGVRPPLRRARLRRGRPRERHARRASSAPRPRPRRMTERAARALPDAFRSRRARHPRRRRRRARLRRARRARSSSSSTPPRSRRTTGRRRDPQTDFDGQRQRHAEPARGDARARARRHVRLLLDQQGLRRHARTRLPLVELERAARAARGPRVLRRHRHVDVDRPLARTRCSASPRRPPTCSCRSTGATSTCRPSASAAAA